VLAALTKGEREGLLLKYLRLHGGGNKKARKMIRVGEYEYWLEGKYWEFWQRGIRRKKMCVCGAIIQGRRAQGRRNKWDRERERESERGGGR
jgi:hypothetical protein